MSAVTGRQFCQSHHVGLVLEGTLHIQMADGIELEFKDGDVLEIPPGHDAWVVGDRKVVKGAVAVAEGARVLAPILLEAELEL